MCACVEKSGLQTWGMRAFFQCQQLAIERTSHQKSSFTSVKFAKTVTINHKTIRPQNANMLDIVAFRRNVKEFTQFVNTGPLLTNSAIIGSGATTPIPQTTVSTTIINSNNRRLLTVLWTTIYSGCSFSLLLVLSLMLKLGIIKVYSGCSFSLLLVLSLILKLGIIKVM